MELQLTRSAKTAKSTIGELVINGKRKNKGNNPVSRKRNIE